MCWSTRRRHPTFALAAEASPRFHESVIQFNLLAPLHLAQEANRHVKRQDGGRVILFFGSVSALRPSPGTAYGAAKAGALRLVQSLAVEWAPRVRLAAVSPGPALTQQAGLHFGDADGVASVANTTPLGRLAAPADIGAACVSLASPRGAYVSGTNLVYMAEPNGRRFWLRPMRSMLAFPDKCTVDRSCWASPPYEAGERINPPPS
ncbi:hypothetical protein AWV79_11180 [Cupriavidus sp. UYMMa02A]|nr:hypothetical protein AWV79_11180 [Cupriavidus sp. UYMMa02A]